MHTVCEVGFWSHPKVLAFSAKVANPDAGAWILRLREFVLLHGTDDGKLPGYSNEEIAAVIRPTCKPARMFTSLADFGFLRRRRKTWYLPDWKKSPMGKYCEDREWDRKKKKELRAAAHAARLEEQEVGTSGGRPVDVPETSSGNLTVSNKGRPVDGPSASPSGAGEREADARFQWFWELYPKPRNPLKCKKLLAEMDNEAWAQLRHALPRHREIYMSRNARYVFPADKYLSVGTFWELRKETPRKSEPKTDAKKNPVLAEPTPEELKDAKLKFLREQLSDPDLPEKLKENAKAKWRKTYDGEEPWSKWRTQPQKVKAA